MRDVRASHTDFYSNRTSAHIDTEAMRVGKRSDGDAAGQQRCCRSVSADRSGAKKQLILAQHHGELPATLQNAIMTKKRKSQYQGSASVRDSEADIAQPCVCLLCCRVCCSKPQLEPLLNAICMQELT